MGGWKDAPVVGDAGNAWERAPVVDNPSIPVRDIPGAIGRAAKQSALPIAGQLIGTGIGLATAPITGAFALPATIGLESAGGALGEALNQKLGITEPSTNQILMQGAIPGGTRLLGGLMRPGMEIAPPLTKGAEFLNRIAAPEARLTLSRMAAPEAESLFNRAFESGAMFHTGDTLRTIDRQLANLGRGANADQLYGRTIGILQNLRDRLARNNGHLDPRNYQTELRDLGAALRTAEGRTINQVEQGAVKDVYAALAAALDRESIPGPPRVTARFTPGRGRAGAEDAEAIHPSVYEEYPGAEVQASQTYGTPNVNRNMGSPTPLQPNVPSTEVNLPKFQTSQPMPFPQGGPPGLRNADEIIPAPKRPDPRMSASDAGNAERLRLGGPPEDLGTIRFGVRSNAREAMAAQDLLLARQYVKRQAVLDEIEESVGKADKILRGQGDNTQFNAAAVMRDLKNNPFWNGTKGERNPAFTPAEKREIESLFTLLNKLPALQPGAGVNAGSMRVLQRTTAMGAGGTAGGMASGGDPLLTGAAALAGAALPTMASFGRVLNIALRTETGRAELAHLLRQPGATLQSVMTALTGGATASTATPGQMQRRPTTMPTPFPLEK